MKKPITKRTKVYFQAGIQFRDIDVDDIYKDEIAMDAIFGDFDHSAGMGTEEYEKFVDTLPEAKKLFDKLIKWQAANPNRDCKVSLDRIQNP